ncbi:ABC transporter substrate-binding protein [Halococcus salifodinae]|uniref:ABC-type dipeptide transport system, periplasmic component n=1 Tax=Halococcus salifodinae DSM 8989 TaxID=1227456 RepID=M0NCR3_9EURY|nr:ABC transporter substrate-binding protein [Halococcus salifodinae]EMA55631.1 ABC-type dipeptide transport system, periplasmic component [Halococcus salifodinae DSM 8989]
MAREADSGRSSVDRRRYLKRIGATGVLVTVAGCAGGNGGGGNDSQGGAGSSKQGNESGDGANGSSDGTGGDSGGNDQTLIIGQNTGMGGDEPLDPHKATRIGTQEVLFAINEPLFRVNPELKPVPHLAKDYSVNDDATEHTMTIEDSITFHNGEKLTAEVARWNLERFLSESSQSYLVGDSVLAKTEVTGDQEVTVTYDEPFALLPQGLTDWHTALVSKKAAEDAGDRYGFDTVVGTGPYKFAEWSQGSYIQTERFDEYDWGPNWLENRGPGKVSQFRFESHPEPTTLLNELTDGGVHLSKSILLSDAKKVEENANTGLKRKKFVRQSYLCPNTQKPPMDDVNVRKAADHAINKEAVIKAALDGEGYKIWALMTPFSKNSLDKEQAKKTGQQFDQKKARQLLEEAGWTNSGEGQTRSKDGTKLSIDFLTFSIPREKSIGTTVQPMLGDVGFDVNLRVLEAGTLYNELEGGAHDLVVMAYGGQFSINTLSATLTSARSAKKGGTNYSLWENEEFDSLIDKAQRVTSDEERHQALVDAQLIVQDQAPVVPINGYNKILGHTNSVTGIETMVNDHQWWPVKEYLRHTELDL